MLANPSLLEPTSLSLFPGPLPETCCTPKEVGPGVIWQGHWESLQLGLWLRDLSPPAADLLAPGWGTKISWHLYILHC